MAVELKKDGQPKSPQQRYLEKVIEEVPCACGCGGIVKRRQVHYFPSYLKQTEGKLPSFLNGHNKEIMAKAVSARAEQLRGQRGPDSMFWKGGKTISPLGYIYIWTKDGYIAEHRLVAEDMLGRKLTAEEIVHHKDGDRQNNSPQNLEVTTNGAHRSFHPIERDEFGRFKKGTSWLRK